MENAISVASVFLTLGIAAGGVTSAIDNHKYNNALQEPGFLHLVDQYGNPVGEELK